MNEPYGQEPESVGTVSTWVYRTEVQLRKLRERLPDVEPPLDLRGVVDELDSCLQRLEEFTNSGEDADIDIAAPDSLSLPARLDVCTYADAVHRAAESLDAILAHEGVPRWMRGVFGSARSSLMRCAGELAPAALIVAARVKVLVPEALTKNRMSPRQLVYMADRAAQGEDGRKVPYHVLTFSDAPYQPVASVRVLDQPCGEPGCSARPGQSCHSSKPLWAQHVPRMLLAVRALAGIGSHGWQPRVSNEESEQ